MFSFDDSISSRALGHPVVAVDVSATPIYDSLEAEWRRMFRAIPHERSNEDYAAIQPTYGAPQAAITHAYAQDQPFPSLALPLHTTGTLHAGGYTAYGRHRGTSLVPAHPP
ncbi:hypothetical protein, partial [Streptomyces sp. SID3343]|uniref:hypothetical protein n=1 Tax=Streptomyces sp. SID3343 TaxID=2690260 RepID=UPI0013713521